MINLLPYDKRSEIKAGALNTRLVRYVIILLVASAVVMSLTGVAYVTLVSERTQADQKSNDSKEKLSKLEENRAKLDEFKKDLATAKSSSDVQVNYSKIFTAIGSALPQGAVIDQLDINPSTIGQGISMTINARNKRVISSLKQNMQNNPAVFESVSYQFVNFDSCSTTQAVYKCEANLNVTFNESVLSKGEN